MPKEFAYMFDYSLRLDMFNYLFYELYEVNDLLTIFQLLEDLLLSAAMIIGGILFWLGFQETRLFKPFFFFFCIFNTGTKKLCYSWGIPVA